MKPQFIAATACAIALSWLSPSQAADISTADSSSTSPSTSAETTLSQAAPTARQVLEACVQNRADTLPNPFVDVSPNHWAFKAVLTMHYCGAFREATPRSLIDRLAPAGNPSGQQSQLPTNPSSF